MKRLVLSILTLLLSSATCLAQEMTIKSFELVANDISASTQRRNDFNGEACALVKVLLARSGATFHGNVVGETSYSQSEYWVYMTRGSKMLQVKLDGYLPLKVTFPAALESMRTYTLSILLPNAAEQGTANYSKSVFTLKVTPKHAVVSIDNKAPQSLKDDGTLYSFLDRGNHTYRIMADGYETLEKSFTLGTERLDVTERLTSSMATLEVICATDGVDIYVNEERQQQNTSSWTGTLPAASYLVEARKQGYYSQQQSVELQPKQNCHYLTPCPTSHSRAA